MTVTQHVDDSVYRSLTKDHLKKIQSYIESDMTATKISNKGPKNRDIITAEVIYYSMIALNIPFECQKWHLNRLFTLINVCNIKNSPPKKMGKKELMRRNAELNSARRKALITGG